MDTRDYIIRTGARKHTDPIYAGVRIYCDGGYHALRLVPGIDVSVLSDFSNQIANSLKPVLWPSSVSTKSLPKWTLSLEEGLAETPNTERCLRWFAEEYHECLNASDNYHKVMEFLDCAGACMHNPSLVTLLSPWLSYLLHEVGVISSLACLQINQGLMLEDIIAHWACSQCARSRRLGRLDCLGHYVTLLVRGNVACYGNQIASQWKSFSGFILRAPVRARFNFECSEWILELSELAEASGLNHSKVTCYG